MLKEESETLIKKNPAEMSFRKLALAKFQSKEDLPSIVDQPKDLNYCPNFNAEMFSKAFSKITLKKVEPDNEKDEKYIVLSGSLSDLLHYCILSCWNSNIYCKLIKNIKNIN